MGNQNTTTLFGDGRHPVGTSVTIKGERLRIRFVGPDKQVDIEGIGTKIPLDIAEELVRFRGSGIRYPGAGPVDAKEHEAKQKEIEDDDSIKRGEQEGVNPDVNRKWPTGKESKAALLKVAVAEGLRKADIDKLEKGDIAEAIRDVYRKKYPEWAEQEDKK